MGRYYKVLLFNRSIFPSIIPGLAKFSKLLKGEPS